MNKDLTTVTQNRIRYWQWDSRGRYDNGYYVTDGAQTKQLSYDQQWVDIDTEWCDKDKWIPDSAVLLSGIPLAYA